MQEDNKSGVIVAGIAVLVIAAAVIGFVVMSGNDETDTTATDTTTSTTEEAAPAEVSGKNIVELAQDTPSLSTLVDAVVAADLASALSAEDGEITVFAPNNAAFEALPAGTLEDLLKPENKKDLANILTFHVVSGKVTADKLSDGQKITTLQGDELTVKIMNGKVMINGAEVLTADVEASNGVVHIIDSVLLPS